MIAQRTNDPVESARRVFSAFTNPSLGREQVEPLIAEIDQLRQTRDDLLEANNRYQQEGRDARAEVRSLSESKREVETMLKRLYREYVNTLEIGRDRILFFGGDCDPVDVMEAGNPVLVAARAVIAKEAGHAE